jgi:hypothetical protein
MADLFAFTVAAVAEVDPEPGELGFYDPDTQQFVWAGDGEVSLGAALCSTWGTGWHTCRSTGTSCTFSGGKDCFSSFNLCYNRCDYG